MKKRRLRLKKIPTIIVASLMIVSLLYLNFSPAFSAFATSYGEGDINFQVDFGINDDNFSTENVTVNGSPWSSHQDEYKTSNGEYAIHGTINSTNGDRPMIMWGGLGNYMDEYGSVEVRPESETEYSFDINLTNIGTAVNGNNEIINFIGFGIEAEGNNPGPGGGGGESETVNVSFDTDAIAGNTVTFDVDGTDVTLEVVGTNIENGEIRIPRDNLGSVTFNIGNTFNEETMQVYVAGANQYSSVLNVQNGVASLNGLNIPNGGLNLGISLKNNNPQPGPGGGSNTQDYQGNGHSTLNYKINGVIEYTPGAGYDYGVGFRINDVEYRADGSKAVFTEDTAYERNGYGELVLDENGDPIVVKDPETMEPMTEKTSLTITGDTINYDYDENTNKVNFVFTMAPGTVVTSIKINNQSIANLPSTKEELAAHYVDHSIEIPVNGIDKADVYNIEIEARYPNEDEEFLGNFLWDYNPQGYTGPDDKILNGTMHFVKAEYNGHTYTTEEEIRELGGVFIWRDAERKNNYTEEWEGVGEAQFPVGTKLTVAIIPDAGYQLVSFGINGGNFEPQEEIGTYTFEVEGGPFHLQAEIAQVDDVVKSRTNKVSSGTIALGGEEDAMSVGTARLDVEDTDLTSEQISNFKEAAGNYEISEYLNISLFNTVFKGTEEEAWDTQVRNLDNKAVITLKLDKNVNGDEIVIVHEKHDGSYEIIPTTYDASTHTITFETDSFSNYAIASKENTAVEKLAKALNPKTGDNIYIYGVLLLVSATGLIVYIKKNKKA